MLRTTTILAATFAIISPAAAEETMSLAQWLAGGQEYYSQDGGGYRPYYRAVFQSYYMPAYSYYPYSYYYYYSPYLGPYYYRYSYPGYFRYDRPGVYYYQTAWQRGEPHGRR